jgi:predicted nuclease with TOPRIM domain
VGEGEQLMRGSEELSKKLTESERQCNEHFERVKNLEYQLAEVIGCAEEYLDMPCQSLKERLRSAIARANIAVGK